MGNTIASKKLHDLLNFHVFELRNGVDSKNRNFFATMAVDSDESDMIKYIVKSMESDSLSLTTVYQKKLGWYCVYTSKLWSNTCSVKFSNEKHEYIVDKDKFLNGDLELSDLAGHPCVCSIYAPFTDSRGDIASIEDCSDYSKVTFKTPTGHIAVCSVEDYFASRAVFYVKKVRADAVKRVGESKYLNNGLRVRVCDDNESGFYSVCFEDLPDKPIIRMAREYYRAGKFELPTERDDFYGYTVTKKRAIRLGGANSVLYTCTCNNCGKSYVSSLVDIAKQKCECK